MGRKAGAGQTAADRRYKEKREEERRRKKSEYNKTEHGRAMNKARLDRWKAKNKEHSAAYQKAYAQDPDHKKAHREACQRYRDSHPESQKQYWYRSQYGMSLEDKQAMLDSQGGVCAICGVALDDLSKAHIDHCHVCDVVRGILCNRCNIGLGFVDGWFMENQDKILEYMMSENCYDNMEVAA